MIPHMVICAECGGDVEATGCKICEGKGYLIVWQTELKDITASGAIEQLHGKFKEEL